MKKTKKQPYTTNLKPLKTENNKYLCNIDWLQISYLTNLFKLLNADVYKFQIDKYLFLKQSYNTQAFKHIWFIYDTSIKLIDNENLKIAEIQEHPTSKIINENLCIIKFDNLIWYSRGGFHYVKKIFDCQKAIILNENIINEISQEKIKSINPNNKTATETNNEINDILNIKPYFEQLKISRIDLSLDYIDNSLKTSEYIRKLAGQIYEHSDSRKEVTFLLKNKVYDYIRVGNKGVSEHYYKIYNKTKEMQNAKFKRYILEFWQNNFENFNYNLHTVYRFEATIQTNKYKFLNENTGELIEFDLKNDINNFYKIYDNIGLITKSYISEKINVRSVKFENKIQFFNLDLINYDLLRIYKAKPETTSNRIDKVVLKKVAEMKNYYIAEINAIIDNNHQEKEYRNKIANITEILADYSQQKNLVYYLAQIDRNAQIKGSNYAKSKDELKNENICNVLNMFFESKTISDEAKSNAIYQLQEYKYINAPF